MQTITSNKVNKTIDAMIEKIEHTIFENLRSNNNCIKIKIFLDYIDNFSVNNHDFENQIVLPELEAIAVKINDEHQIIVEFVNGWEIYLSKLTFGNLDGVLMAVEKSLK